MDFDLKLAKPKKRVAYISALTMGLAYIMGMCTKLTCIFEVGADSLSEGGILPMIPYFATDRTTRALIISICITAVILVVFGYLKAQFVGLTPRQCGQSAVVTLVTGMVPAGASYGIVRAIADSQIA